jgi:hypothetical protein
VLGFGRTDTPRPLTTPPDRYEPLPGLFGLPGYLLRKLSPRGRRVVAALGVLLRIGAVAGAIALAPRISESKREHAAAERRAHARAVARERAQLVAESRPRRGSVASDGVLDAGALIAAIEEAITRDARARARSGELDNPALRTDCRGLGRRDRRLLLSCTAITSDVPATENTSGVVSGYSFRAAVSPASGRYAFCKSVGRPAVGFSERELSVELPRACGR